MLSYHRPVSLYFPPYYVWPPLAPVTQSHKPRGQRGDLGGPRLASWQTLPDKRLKAILIAVSVCGVSVVRVCVCVCVKVVRRLWRRPGEISERGNDRADKDNGRICTLPNKTCAPGIMQIPPSILTSVNIKRRRRRRG